MAELILVETDQPVRVLVTQALRRAGHKLRVAVDGAGLRRLLSQKPADLVVLDLDAADRTPPHGLVGWLRAEGGDPGILLLTAGKNGVECSAGLEAGADDCLVKPFAPAELMARITAVLRRRRPEEGQALRLGPWLIDVATRLLTHDDGRQFRATRSELPMLLAFARHPGQVLSREELLAVAPGRSDLVFDRSIDNRIARLRQKVEADPAKPVLISSVHGRGYVHRP